MSTNRVLIESKTVGAGGSASISFTNIPQTYTDLKILISARSDESGGTAQSTGLSMSINGVTANRTAKTLQAYNGTTVESTSITTGAIGTIPGTAVTNSTFNNLEVYIPNYTSSNFKSFSVDSISENNSSSNFELRLTAGLWSQTNAITSIGFTSNAGNLAEGSTFYLYGISNVTSTTKATGGIVSSDGTYNYHMFPYSGTFTPTAAITVDYLVIAGGGSGGWGTGSGGGGAGGLRSTVGTTGGGGSLESALSLTANTAYTVTVGAGGAGLTQSPGNVYGNSGSNSVFSTITATGGGGGGGENTGVKNGVTGGSGGGSSYLGDTGGAGTTNQGYAGGVGGGTYAGGGGGGAGAVGQSVSGNTGGNGGNGVQITAFANPTQTGVNDGRYAGGGGGSGQDSLNTQAYGGTGGTGGGGTGAGYFNNSSGIAAIAGRTNTGGGGGGGGAFTGGGSGSGGSGLVIIRYAI